MALQIFAILVAACLMCNASHAQSSAICTKIVQYGACTTAKYNDIAACNSMVTSVPDFHYWDCVCNGQNQLLQCYDLCPEDINMQLQRQSQAANTLSTCQYVNEQRANGADAPLVQNTTTTVPGIGKTVTVPVPAKRVLPPEPKKNSTSTAGAIQYDSGSSTLNHVYVAGLALSLVVVSAVLV